MKCWLGILLYFVVGVTVLTTPAFLPSAAAQVDLAVARKFDEFVGPLGHCDFGARLDNFAIELQNNPEVTGYIVAYGPEGTEAGHGIVPLIAAKDYLENTRGLGSDRIRTHYAGRYERLDRSFTELWIIPNGASLPEPVTFEPNIKAFTGKFAEYDFWEGSGEDEGISQGNVVFGGFTDVLRQQPDSFAYVVIRSTKEAAPGEWRRAARDVSTILQDVNKVKAERIKVIFAGYNKDQTENLNHTTVELWVLPRTAPPPVAEVKGPEPTPEKAVRWRSFGVYELEDEADRKDIFEAFADVLRRNKELSVSIIVHQQSPEQKTAESESEKSQEASEPASEPAPASNSEFKLPDLDLTRIAEQWQSELAAKHGISIDRLTIILGQSEDWNYGMMEIWIVPAGAAQPDPNGQDLIENEVDADQAIPQQ